MLFASKRYTGLAALLFLLSSCGNYKYAFKSSCNCITTNNPAGITMVSIFPYETDPDIHEHNCGFYEKTTPNKVKQLSLIDFNKTDFRCYPCMEYTPNRKYVLVFKGKDNMDPVSVKVYKDSAGVIHGIK